MAEVRATTIAAAEDFGGFARLLGTRLDLDPVTWRPSDPLDEALTWDSLRAVEVLTWLDELGVHLPDELVGELRTLADLHHYVVTIGTRVPDHPARRRRPLVGPRVRLEPLGPDHQAAAYALYTHGSHLTHYRLRGTTPSPEGFHRALWDRALAQFLAVHDDAIVGLVSAFEPDLRNRHVHVAAVTDPEATPGTGVEAMALLVEHLFAEFDLRKVYAEVLAPHLAAFASGLGRVFVVEGRLTDHEYLDGGYHDMVVLALTRERWALHVDRLLGRPAL